MPTQLEELLAKAVARLKSQRVWPKILLTVVGTMVLLLLAIFFVASIYQEAYHGKVYPGVSIGGYEVGGLAAPEIKNFIESLNNRFSKEGLDLETQDFRGQDHKLKMNTVLAGETPVELVRLDSDEAVKQALRQGRSGGFIKPLVLPLYYRLFEGAQLKAPVVVNGPVLQDLLEDLLYSYESPAHNAALVFEPGATFNPRVVSESAGKVFNYPEIIQNIQDNLAVLSFAPLRVSLRQFSPTVTIPDVQKILGNLPQLFAYGNLNLNFIDPQTALRRDWVITPAEFAQWLIVAKDSDGNFIFAFNDSLVKDYLEREVKPLVEVAAQDAKFVMADSKVKEFQASRSGLSLDLGKTLTALDAAIRERNYLPTNPIKTVSLAVDIVESKVKTAEVNDLGITDVIGVGISTFKDSHTNRIKNIANAVQRLNGVLIKPGEVFSANKFAGPYTAENGFLPEQVIKGREIKKEIGGGMCQIGTTLFRMAMNAGMDIIERRNHSLVVGYYADPVNGNPGTDATLYEPEIDFKFVNDTGNYLLLQTEIDYKRQQLTFTLWGKPDGRKGWYSHPLVSKWIPAGEPQTIEVEPGKLLPGQEKCQAAFRGAVASFTYSRVTPSGQKIDRVFESYYRPLPKICMVGVTASSTPTSTEARLPLSEPGE